MKTTALTQKHIDLGAKMVPFAGFNMPVYYSGIKDEHNTVRNAVGIFDVSHMGEFTVNGPKAFELIQYITSNNVANLFPGKVQYSCFPNDKGGIVDDLLVYKISEEQYTLVVNAANIDKDWSWVNLQNEKFGAEITNKSDYYAQVAVQGPLAVKALQPLTDVDLSSMEYYTFTIDKFAGFDDIVISATGYTGSGGFEIYANNDQMPIIWDKIMQSGQEFGIKAIGLGARDTLRLEAGFCLYGNDINDETSPIEAGLGWITKFDKDFILKDHHLKIKEQKPSKKLVGFELIDKGVPRQHMELVNDNGEVIGEVTSGTQSPLTGKSIGMAYVNSAYSKTGTEINIQSRNKLLKAQIVRPPFFGK